MLGDTKRKRKTKQSWSQAGKMLEWSGGLPSCSTSDAASEAEGELPSAEKVQQKKENEGKKA